jgi:hypothetical protein
LYAFHVFVFKVFLFFEIYLHEKNYERGVVTQSVSDQPGPSGKIPHSSREYTGSLFNKLT